MSININSIKFSDDYTGLISGYGSDIGTPFLMGCVGDLIYVKIDFDVAWSLLDSIFTFDSPTKSIKLENCSGLPTIFPNSPSFINNGFKVNDTIVITGTLGAINDGTYTIATITDYVITVNETIVNTAMYANVNIYGATTINSFDFYYNLIGNNDPATFISLTDSKAVQKFTGVANPYYYGATFTLQPNSTSQAWWDKKVDSVNCVPTITDYGYSVDYKQEYSMIFPFLITPLFLSTQLNIIQNSYDQNKTNVTLNSKDFDVPSYFNDQCLKFIYQIDAKFDIVNSTADHTSSKNRPTGAIVGGTFGNDSRDGNTSWFDTFFPTGVYLSGNLLLKQQYTATSVTYKDVLSNPLTSIDINNVTSVETNIRRTGSATITNEKFVVNFMWLPTNTGVYQGYAEANQANFREVFLHDRCRTTIGLGAHGDQYGLVTQVLTNVIATSVDANNFKVNFDIDFGALCKSTLTADLPKANYMLWITPQSTDSISLDTSNRNATIIDVNQAFLNTDDASLLNIITNGTNQVQYFKTPDTFINPLTDFRGFAGEYGLMWCQFNVKAGCVIQNFTSTFEVAIIDTITNEITNSFPLLIWSNLTTQFFDGVLNNIDVNESNNFNLPASDLRNYKQIYRSKQLDTPGYYAYSITQGFQLGYQYWQNLTQYDSMFELFHTQYWPVYTQGYAGRQGRPIVNVVNPRANISYGIKQKMVWNILDPSTNITTEFVYYTDIYALDEASNLPGNKVGYKTMDVDGNNLNLAFSADTVTIIVSTFTGANLDRPLNQIATLGELVVYYNNGNKTIYDRITTLDTTLETKDSLWLDIKMVEDPSSTTINIIGTIDFSQLTIPATDIKAYAKVTYQTSNNLVTDSQIDIITDGGDDIDIN